jgi:hypothetical protein
VAFACRPEFKINIKLEFSENIFFILSLGQRDPLAVGSLSKKQTKLSGP